MTALVLAVVLGAVVLGAAVLGRLAWSGRHEAPAPAASEALPSVTIGGPFDLVRGDGAEVRDTSFPGKWQLVYFGYTSCPDVCPTTLQAIAGALHALGARADRIVPLFITIDPARDTPDVVRRYAALFDPRIVGLTGTAAQIAAAEDHFRVFAQPVTENGIKAYTVDHSSFIYLMDPEGKLRALFNRSATADLIAAGVAKAQG